MKDVIGIPFGEGEAKEIPKKDIMKRWLDRWDRDNSRGKYYSLYNHAGLRYTNVL